MQMAAPAESTAWCSEILQSLPVAAALFSLDGLLLSASPRFRRAVGAEAVQARFSEKGDRANLFRSGGIPQDCSAKRLSSGQVLVWLEEVGGDIQRRRAAFLTIASHDLRASLANPRSYASLLLSPRMELGEGARRCAEVIQKNADRALRLLGECFDLFLYQLDALDLDRGRDELGPLFEDVVAQARAIATSRGVRLEVELPPRLPKATVDRARLGRAVLAFVAHSLARVRKGEPVRFTVKEQRKTILVEVSDAEQLDGRGGASAIYDAEARAIAERKLGDGFRLGLARATIEAHGGEVGVRTGEGSGSAFLFTLPIDPEGSADPHSTPPG